MEVTGIAIGVVEPYHTYILVVPHKTVAEVSKIGTVKERLVVVSHRWQSKDTGGLTGG